jgi:hypothetical protein
MIRVLSKREWMFGTSLNRLASECRLFQLQNLITFTQCTISGKPFLQVQMYDPAILEQNASLWHA